MRAKTDYGLETLVRMLYLEPVVRGRRVLVAGRDVQGMVEALRRMGAREVRTQEPGAAKSLPWDLAGLRGKRDSDVGRGLGVKAGEVDLVLVPELGELEDYRAVLGEAARVIGHEGIVVVATRNAECMVPISSTGLDSSPEVWSVDSLQEMLGQYFDEVELVGQSPFLGYALASWDPRRGREGVRLDTSLMNEQGEDPEFLVAVCSRGASVLPLTNALFQMPMVEMTLVEGRAPDRRGTESDEEAELRAEVESLRREMGNRNVVAARLEKEIERLEGEAEAARHKMFELRQKMEHERRDHQNGTLDTAIRREAGKIPETWLTERATLVREAEELAKAKARAEKEILSLQASMDQEIEAVRAAASAAARTPDTELQGKLERLEDRAKDMQGRADRAEARSKDLLTKLKQAEARLREEETRSPEMGKRIAELESTLDKVEKDLATCRAERDRVAGELQRALAERDRSRSEASRGREETGKLGARAQELEARLREIEACPVPAPPAALPEELSELRAELARRDEIVRDLIRDLEVLPCLAEQQHEGHGREQEIHEIVGTLEKLRGEKADLERLAAGLAAELDRARAQARAAELEAVEASAIVEIVGSALEGAGQAAAPAAMRSVPSLEHLDRALIDIQEHIRRIASDPRAESVARDLGLVWVRIEERRRAL